MASESIVLSYGSHAHDEGEVSFAYSSEALLTAAQTPYAERVQIDLTGELHGSTIAEINTKVAKLVAAYSVDGLDFSVKDGTGKKLALSLASSACIGGLRVTRRPSFPEGRDAALVTFMPFQITLVGEREISDPTTVLLSYQETINFEGGGPEYAMLETRVGRPQRQGPVTNQTIYRATQEGNAVGLHDFPTIPSAIWPAYQIRPRRRSLIGGRLAGVDGTYINKGVRWRYDFESPVPLIGTPHNWGVE